MCDRFEYSSVIRGHHMYAKIFIAHHWKDTPEPKYDYDNDYDSFSVAIKLKQHYHWTCAFSKPFQYCVICFEEKAQYHVL